MMKSITTLVSRFTETL